MKTLTIITLLLLLSLGLFAQNQSDTIKYTNGYSIMFFYDTLAIHERVDTQYKSYNYRIININTNTIVLDTVSQKAIKKEDLL